MSFKCNYSCKSFLSKKQNGKTAHAMSSQLVSELVKRDTNELFFPFLIRPCIGEM